jgi:uncharacterized protein (TIGR02145 family)
MNRIYSHFNRINDISLVVISLWFLIGLFSCSKEFINPYDPATRKDEWMPRDFRLDTLGINSLHLHWQQDNRHIDGYVLQKYTNGALKEYLVFRDTIDFIDSNAVEANIEATCPEIRYEVLARAGRNRSLAAGMQTPIYMPLSTPAFAGEDIMVTDTSTSVQLNAQPTLPGESGRWTILSGTGGAFANNTQYNTKFSGLFCTQYVLRWSKQGCTDSYDDLSVAFIPEITQANAGDDQVFYNNTIQATLNANNPGVHQTGLWSVVSGEGGEFADATSPITQFTGQSCTDYVLLWSISGVCGTTSDGVNIRFDKITTAANAGNDQDLAILTTSLAANTPAAGEIGQWIILSGAGGVLSDVNSPISTFSGVAGRTYTLQWTISYSTCSYLSTDVVIIKMPLSLEGNGLTDIDGNNYTSVILGSQEWMGENLKTTRFCNGDLLLNIENNNDWIVESTAAWCNFNNNSSYAEIYGKLYNRFSVTDARNVCPCGWHVPSLSEWNVLFSYLGGSQLAGAKMKSTGTTYWNSPNTGATNESRFSALPGGFRRSDLGSFSNIGIAAHWWCATASFYIYNSYDGVTNNGAENNKGYSIRCIKD